MKNASPQIDAYIANAPEYARPILKKLRALFHRACPRIEETMKWNFPHFEHKGIVGSMAAFKNYVGFGFWKGKLMRDPQGLFEVVGKTGMNATQVQTVGDLPPDKVLVAYIKEAARLNEDGVKLPQPAKKKSADKKLAIPDDLQDALRHNKKALATFDGFSYSNRKDYVEWINQAKQESTRQKRLSTTIEWLTEGKPRNWKYMKGR